jgi:hypothetical protein
VLQLTVPKHHPSETGAHHGLTDPRTILFWCLVIDLGIYVARAVAVVTLKGFVYQVLKRFFGLDEEASARSVMRYLGNFKLLIIAFNVTPWIAVMIIR